MKVAGHSANDKHPKEDSDKTSSANLDKDDVKENKASTQSSYYRSFMSQSDRPPPMKLESKRFDLYGLSFVSLLIMIQNSFKPCSLGTFLIIQCK